MKRHVLTSIFLLASSVSSLAIAQTGDQSTAEDVGEPLPSSDSGQSAPGAADPAVDAPAVERPAPTTPAAATERVDESGGIEDIVVTATRREERLQDVPVTVTAVTGASLAAADISTVRNLNQIIPAYTGGRGGGAFFPVIRGVGSTGISVGDESNVALYIDGVYQPDTLGNWVDLVEVERVEVLRGPQGTVFGRNATGGLINVITPDPSFDTRGRVGARIGFMRNGANTIDVRGYITGGLSSTIAADLAVNYVNVGGYVKNLVDSNELGHDEVLNVRGKLLFQPSDRARIVLTGIYMDRNGSPNTPQPVDGNTRGRQFGGIIADDPWEASLTVPTVLDITRKGVALQTQFELGAVNLETTTGYSDATFFQLGDSDSTNIFLEAFPAWTHSKSLSQEVRLLSAGKGPLKWILGGYFFDLDGDADFQLISRNGTTGVVSTRDFKTTIGTRSYAGFAEATYEVVPSLFVTGGIRYTTEDREFEQIFNGRNLFGTADASFSKWTYRGAVRYNFAEDANIYASYGTGFKSGVFNMSGISPIAVEPETITAAEVGLKADPLHWLRTNLAIYHYSYDDLQVQAKEAVGPGYILQNAATAEIYGGELELSARASRDLLLRGWVAYTNATYDDFPGAQGFNPLPQGGNQQVTIDASGNRLGRTPKWSGNLGFEWGRDTAQGRIGFSSNLFYSSRVYYDFQNVFSQKPYVLLNSQFSLTTPDERLRFTLVGSNLTNEAVFQQIRPSTVGTDGFYEMPRRVSIGLEFMF